MCFQFFYVWKRLLIHKQAYQWDTGISAAGRGLSFWGATGLKKKFKIPQHYVFAYGHCAHTYAFLAFWDENCTTSLKKCQKMAKIDKFIAPGDLDLDRATLTLVPGSQFFLGA